eukprot:TRINITY_DN34503_c0_g1_i1.p1 TRINITY_DN34503_c0_g1~~TRINITY_DN34503_c0_g1_i1.p1  ORF type:complete len:532 (+),score=74.05 TRINITY_DN34503_c0_g1_i1:166-1596(+)
MSQPWTSFDPFKTMDFRPSYIPAPRDEDNPSYIVSFAPEEIGSPAFHEFFAFHGFVVVRNVLTTSECEATVDDVVRHIRTEAPEFDLFNPSTHGAWNSAPYGQPRKQHCGGIFTPQLLRNRLNRMLHRVFAECVGTSNLLVSHDRFACYRPTVVPSGADATLFRTPDNIHLDLDPLAYTAATAAPPGAPQSSTTGKRLGLDGKGARGNRAAAAKTAADSSPRTPAETLARRDALDWGGTTTWVDENNLAAEAISYGGLAVQGVLNLLDNRAEGAPSDVDVDDAGDDGGLMLVPGFHKSFAAFAAAAGRACAAGRLTCGRSVRFEERSAIRSAGQRIPMRAGSLVVWDQRLAHGSRGNRSGRPRVVQFVRMFPSATMSAEARARRACAVRAALIAHGLQPVVAEAGPAEVCALDLPAAADVARVAGLAMCGENVPQSVLSPSKVAEVSATSAAAARTEGDLSRTEPPAEAATTAPAT